MKKHLNLTAYENVEDLSNFTSESFELYCQSKLSSCDPYVKFIREACCDSRWQGNVCEIGSGSGHLLFRLEQDGLLNCGIGYEISQSRHQFSEKWKVVLGSRKVSNILGNVLETSTLSNFDLIIGIDLVYQLITPLYPDAQNDMIRWINHSLKRGGYLLLEMMDFQNFIQLIKLSGGNVYRWWEEFPINDPWEFSLAKFSLDEQKDFVWEKKFIRRGSQERSTFTNVLRNYSPEDIMEILGKSGFTCRLFNSFQSGIKLEPGEYIVLANKVQNYQ